MVGTESRLENCQCLAVQSFRVALPAKLVIDVRQIIHEYADVRRILSFGAPENGQHTQVGILGFSVTAANTQDAAEFGQGIADRAIVSALFAFARGDHTAHMLFCLGKTTTLAQERSKLQAKVACVERIAAFGSG